MTKHGRYGARLPQHGRSSGGRGMHLVEKLTFWAPGVIIRRGDRAQVRVPRERMGIEWGQWGTVERHGLGTVKVLLDDGRRINFKIHELAFERPGRPPLPEAA